MNAKLTLNSVAKSFGDNQVLRDFSLTINTGEVVSFIGASGSGKTTLLRCINLLETVDNGSILLDNTEIPDTRDALLVGLLRASGLVDRLFDEPELSRLRSRINQISNLEEISRELTWTVQELRILLRAMAELEAEQ